MTAALLTDDGTTCPNTTVHNVDYHLRQLREKFGARNRSQLAYLAGKMQAV